MRRTFCGTLDYLAPEIVASPHPEYDTAVDVWSLGVVMFELLCGRAPFESDDPRDTVKKIQDAALAVPCYLTPECQDLIRGLLTKDRSTRLKPADVLAHPWIRNNVNTDNNRAVRNGGGQAETGKQHEAVVISQLEMEED
eukprot:PhM_4_TR2362/c0_g1_i1/m.105569/K08850/AURKX; aurora kinase, other